MLTDACNCDCTYCYQKVSNEKKLGRLNIDNIKFLDKILPEFSAIQFFGGEPLLEEQFIFELDKRIDELILEKNMALKPEYIFSTNLTFLSDRFKQFLNKLCRENSKCKFIITVDGIQNIHDKHRIFKNGEPSYKYILDNYNFLTEHNICVETAYIVYNKSHYSNGISMKGCIENIYENFPAVKYVVFNCEGLVDETKISQDVFFDLKFNLLKAILDDVIEEKANYIKCRPFLYQEMIDICGSVMSENADKIKCIMAKKKFTIMPNGEVYMCADHYYSHQKPIQKLTDSSKLKDTYLKYSIENNVKPCECEVCKIKTLCRYCPLEKDDFNTLCKQNKIYYEMILSYLSKIYSNKKLLKYFVQYSKMTDGMVFAIYKYLTLLK